MDLNARAIIEQKTANRIMVLIQPRNESNEGVNWHALPVSRVKECASLVGVLKREVKGKTGFKIIFIEETDIKLETKSPVENLECRAPFALYRTLKDPVDSIGVYFLCQATGNLLATGDETENLHLMPFYRIAQWVKTDPK